jgi:hypothetical protein
MTSKHLLGTLDIDPIGKYEGDFYEKNYCDVDVIRTDGRMC